MAPRAQRLLLKGPEGLTGFATLWAGAGVWGWGGERPPPLPFISLFAHNAAPGSILPSHATLESASVQSGEELTLVITNPTVEYYVMQGTVFRNPSVHAHSGAVIL